jgi:alkanesulfonate monooxygenase SsuD/methylene tetrahydromethanopterin reductase-like flavin-dependent oxidoreductase (luciferase family)
MKLGLQIASFTWPGGAERTGATLSRIAQAAEEADFSSLWVMDHFFQIEPIGKPEEPMLEAYSTLNFLAAVTKRIRLGALVTGVIYRYPGILVKTVTTLDVLSGGRAYFGIGAAWNEREATALGVPFPPMKDRFERLEEPCRLRCRCGREMSRRITASTTVSQKRSVRRCRFLNRIHPS